MLTPWIDGTIDERGHLRRLGTEPTNEMSPTTSSMSDELKTCVLGVLLNNPIRVPSGNYRLTMQLRFKKTRYEIR